MNLTTISISPRVCTEAETQALTLWSASALPFCRTWAAQRRLQPPVDILATLQKKRFEVPLISATMLKPLLTVPSSNGQFDSHWQCDSKLEEIVTSLSHDLQQLQALVLPTPLNDHSDRKQSFLTQSRDLRRFQRAISQFQLARIEIVVSEPMIITLFSLQRVTLYIPHWLIDALPRTIFEPNQSFYRARPASLAWLLLDAIVITPDGEFKTL
jgi:hypothetical protein